MGRRTERRWRRRAVVVAVATALLASGCWLQPGNGPGHAYWNPDETTLTTANVASLAEDWTGYAEGSLHSEPIVSGGKVFVSDTTVRSLGGQPTGPLARWAGLGALDAATGATLWTVDISPPMGYVDFLNEGPVEPSAPTIVDDEVWISYYGKATTTTCGGALVRRNADTGAALGTVFSGRASGVTHFDGKLAWTRQALVPAGSCSSTATPQLVVQDAETRATLWTAPADTVALPAVIGDEILVAGTAYPADGCGAATCSALWSADVPAPVHAQAGSPDGHIFLTAGELPGSGPVTVYSVDPDDGHVLWSVPQQAGYYGYNGGVAVADGFVYTLTGYSDVELRVYPVDGCSAPTCDPVWSGVVKLDGAMAPPVVAGGVVYVKTEFRLTAFRAAGCGAPTCQPLTYLTTTGGPTTVSDGKVFVSQRPYSGYSIVEAFSAG
jgi:hypothetical protein